MKSFISKLKRKAGFSMSEVLVATLIMTIATAAVATGVSASLRVYKESVTYSEERVLLSTLSEAITGELRYAREMETKDGRLTYTSDKYGSGVSIYALDSDGKIYVGTDTSKKGNAIIGSGSYITKNGKAVLSAAFETAPAMDDQGTVSAKLKVSGPDNTSQIREIKVRSLFRQEEVTASPAPAS